MWRLPTPPSPGARGAMKKPGCARAAPPAAPPHAPRALRVLLALDSLLRLLLSLGKLALLLLAHCPLLLQSSDSTEPAPAPPCLRGLRLLSSSTTFSSTAHSPFARCGFV